VDLSGRESQTQLGPSPDNVLCVPRPFGPDEKVYLALVETRTKIAAQIFHTFGPGKQLGGAGPVGPHVPTRLILAEPPVLAL
jgi:hypothetical protein